MPTLQQYDVNDILVIEELEVLTFIGVYDFEQLSKQKLLVTMELEIPPIDQAAQQDDLLLTLDTTKVCDTVIRVAAERPRKLVEALIHDIITALFQSFSVNSVSVEVKKFLRPDAKSVSLKIKRTVQRKN